MSRVKNIIYKVNENSNNNEKNEKNKKSRVGSIIERVTSEKITTSVDNNYINSYISDANSFLLDVGDKYKDLGYGNATKYYNDFSMSSGDLINRGKTIRAYLNSNKNRYDLNNVNDLFKYIDEVEKSRDNIWRNLRDAAQFYSNWETEDAYNNALEYAANQRAMLDYDKEAGAKTISDLETTYSEALKIANDIDARAKMVQSGYQRAGTPKTIEEIMASDSVIAELTKQLETYGDVDALNKDLQEKKRFHTLAERAQRGVELNSVSNPNATNYDSQFEQYVSQGKAMDNGKTPVSIFGNTISQNPIEAYRRYYSDLDMRSATDDYGAGRIGNDASFALAMTENEVNTYNYYLAKDKENGTKYADEYLDIISDDVNQRIGSSYFSQIEGKTGQELLFGVNAGVDQFASGIKGLFADGYTAPSPIQYASSAVREDLADDSIPIWYNVKEGKWEDKVLGNSAAQMAYDTTTTVSNMLPSIMVSFVPVVGQAAGAITLGASAAGHAKVEMLNLGYSKSQANLYGAMVGASEAGLQYLLGGITKFGGKASKGLTELALSKVDNAFARVAISLGMNMASEGLEESLQTVIEPWLKSLATGVDFEAPDIDEVLYSGLLGTISALLMEGGTTIAGEVGIKKQGEKLKASGADNINALTNLGKDFAEGTTANRLANGINENSSAYAIGRLLTEVGAGLSERNITDIAAELRANGMSSEAATDTAKWLYKAVDGGYFNKRQQEAYLNDDRISDVHRNLFSNEEHSVNKRNAEYDALYALAQEMSNNKGAKTKAKDASVEVQASTQQEEGSPATEKTPKKEIATDKEFGVSETGKTVYNGNEVEVSSIASVENGGVMVKLNNGDVVNARDVTFGSNDEALLYEAVADMNVDTANDFIQGFKSMRNVPTSIPQSVSDYMVGFNEARTYGELGIPYEALARDGSYANALRGNQAQIAYNRGKINGVYKAKVAQEARTSGAAKVTVDKAKTPRKYEGETHVSEIKKSKMYKSLSDTQKAGVDSMVFLYKALGIDVYFFESPTDAKGKRIGKNGYFKPSDRSVHIDLYAGVDGKGTILFTAPHELTHYIRESLPEKFKAFADILFERLEADGKSVAGLIAKKIEKLEGNGRTEGMTEAEIYDLAHEEVVADACEAMMSDGEAFVQIAEKIKAKDKGLWQAIKDFFADLVAKIKVVYEGLSPDSVEGGLVADMLETATDLQRMWTDMLVEASEVSNIVDIDADTESVSPMLSERTWTESEYVREREKTAKAISKALNVDIKTAYKYIDDINGVARLIADDRARLDYEPNLDDKATVLKPNSDYKYSVDMSTLCAKRLLFTGTFDAIQRALPNMVFDSEDIVSLREMMQKRGYEVACGICYVESTRREIGRITQDFIDSYKESQKTGKPITRTNSEGKVVDLKKTKDQMATTVDTSTDKFFAEKDYTPTLADLNTTDIDLVKRDHPLVYEAYLNFMNARGQSKPKLLETRAEYKGEILKHFKYKSAVESRNRAGGLRLQSFSDFEVPHLIDMMQIVMDMSRVGLKSQAYTKVPAFAEIFGDTGVKINLSLIAKGDGLDSKGNLIFDDVEGINHEEAFKLRDRYSKNVGTILVGKTDAHIIAAMADSRIDYIIPFHKSSWKESLYDALGLTGYADYTDFQNEKPIDKDRKIKNFEPSEYWDFTKSGDENAQIYLEKCREDGRIPKFPQFQGYPGYWKLLIDFKMYDNDGVGSPQEVVKPIFDTEASEKILGEYKGGHKSFPVAKDVVEDFVKEHKYSDRDSEGADIKYSVREIVGDSGKSYGVGVYLDSDLLTGLTDDERVEMVKEYVKELGGSIFTAYDKNGNAVDVHIVESYKKYENEHGKRVFANRHLTNYNKSHVKQEAIALVDELILTARYESPETARHSHGWLDNRGKNDWDAWTTYLQDKENTVWKAKLQIANSVNGEKILYEIHPIEMVEGIAKRDTTTTAPIITQPDDSVKGGSENYLNSDRDDSVSNRTLLANALESTAQNDIERNKLEQYKGKIALIESEQAKLAETRAKIKELSFAKGRRDTEAIKKLQFEANQSANRINTYDRQLLNLESTLALKNVLQREKEQARKREAQKGKEALAKYREKAAETQRELMTRYQESRKRGVESRRKTEIRHKIKDIVSDLNTLLLNPTKDKHVPIGLQKPVAAALDIINMDTVGAEERIAKYDALIAKEKNPDVIESLKQSRDRIALQGENLADKLNALKAAYADIKNSKDQLIKNSHNEAIESLIENAIDVVENTSLRDMSLKQLESVYDMYKAILATVRNANKMFKEGRQETITENSERVKAEVRKAGGHRDRVLKATKDLKKFGWNMLKPIYAMKLIGSNTFTRLYENVRNGEDTWAVDVNEAKEFFQDKRKKYNYNSWDFKKQYTFHDSIGNSFSLSLEQIMSLYAYSKREQADLHLEKGGFIFDDAIEITIKNKLDVPMKYEVNDANPYRLNKEDLGAVIGILETDDFKDVKGFVDDMQAYLSDVMGAKGNEVSLAMYDIKLYNEKHYFPLKTAKYFREFDPEKNGTPKIRNSGFSKKTVPKAGNPIVLSNFMDVWATHVNDMSMYHAFVLPLEDFMRVYNYSSTAGGYDSVQQYIKNAYGAQANTYIETLMNDLNGGARTDPATDLIGKAMSLFKKSAVFASASVVIQQPSAIARAFAYIDPKYFVDKPEATKHKETWEEVKKYAPVAIIKEMGYFDTNMGRSTVDWIRDEKNLMDKIDDVASKAPALADELAWCAIWKAVKREIAATTKLQVGSKEFLKAAGKRFTEVVTKTQVYDSVLSRSALMRSKDTGAKMVTAFMAEPTTSLNMAVDAIIEGKRGDKQFARKVIGAVSASIILNSILVSLVTAARDDDDDETYTEKYLESLAAELIDGFNPLTYIPLVKDIWSIMQGYDIERSDMSIWSDLWQSVENLFSDNKSGFEKTEGVVGSIASIFGLPAKNIMRDARGLYNLFATLFSGTPTTRAGVGEAIGGAVKSSIPLYSRIEKWAGADESKSDKLYDAIMDGDKAHIDRLKSGYKDESAINTAIRAGLRANDSRIKEAAQERVDGDISEYTRIVREIIAEGNFGQDIVVGAVNAEINAINAKADEQDESTDENASEKVSSIYKGSDINDAFESGDTDLAVRIIDDLIDTKVANGMEEKNAKSSVRSSMTSYWKPLYKAAYKANDKDEMYRIRMILKASGIYGNTSDILDTCKGWLNEK